MRHLILICFLGALVTSSCKKCTNCSMTYHTPVGGIEGISEEKYCGKEEEILRYETSFKNQYETYGTVKCARD